MTLTFLRDSTENTDRNDYRLEGTIRWDSAEVLACFAAGTRDWSYEHDLTYGQHFDRKIWNEDFSAFPAEAGAYIDTTVSDSGDVTTLGFGVFRPDKLQAGVDYHYSMELFLPDNPPDGRQPLTLEWQVLNRDCSRPGPWCVGLNPYEDRGGDTLIGASGDFGVLGASCWTWEWRNGASHPGNCSSQPPSEPAPVPEVAPAPESEVSPEPAPEQGPAPAPAPAPGPTSTPTPAPTPAPTPTPAPEPAPGPTPAPAPEPAPAPPPSEAMIVVDNRVTDGMGMREDTPAYLSTVTQNFCKRDGCALSSTDMASGHVVTATCQTQGARSTNGNDADSSDDANPQRHESTRWYGVRWPDGRFGYLSEVWVQASYRGGTGLPAC